jgi:hypothetical protein
MARMLASVVRAVTRDAADPIHALLVGTDEALTCRICRACPADRFWYFGLEGEPAWDTLRHTPPLNLSWAVGGLVPADVEFDLVVAPFRTAPLSAGRSLSATLHVPLLSLFAPPRAGQSAGALARQRKLAGRHNAFPSWAAARDWGFAREDGVRVVPNWEPSRLRNLLAGCLSDGPYDLKWGFT